MAFVSSVLVASLALLNPAFAQSVDGSKYNNPTAGPPSSYFAAATSVPVAALKSAAAKASTAAKDATYPINNDGGAAKVTIHSDWSKFSEGAAFVWVADMDVDCDGLDYKCKGNPDGLPDTNFGALAAYEVPWIVIPDKFGTTYQSVLPGNNIGAVICDGKMFYGIYGDSDGDTPQVIGEASWLMARTCFPNDDLNGNAGHGNVDVTYILFTGKDAVLPSSALNKNYITNFTTLRSMGDNLMAALAKNLGLSGGSGNPTTTLTTKTITGTSPTATCTWSGHCAGASCSTENDCSGDLVCKSGKCANP
ncbi:ribonuclease H-like domain-containing protein [Penicillium atrosanguineum]|uniref:ribonuclease H-like domain-containing protein n=1 Tax=Penicillium atrosanguineum TaxID=1132637 RepID=UPI0023A3EA20|nr:ribonuclease H-like domain-containing protein [Penicillium atrosanguineum]KAJ5305147.1 ribonuclease H-like domain-containing protein [Penicillium atrosanguineum]